MNVLLVISSLHGGGAERVMAWLADCLVKSGDSVCLVTKHDSSSDFYQLNPAVRRVEVGVRRFFPMLHRPYNAWRWRQQLRTVARRERADVVVSFIDAMNLSVLRVFAGTDFPVVVAERTDPEHSQLSWVQRKLRPYLYRRLSRRVVVQTDAFAERVRSAWALSSVEVIPNAVLIDATGVPDAIERDASVLSVGRFTREKGHDVLLDAWAQVAPEFPDWNLRLVGDGPLRPALEQQVARLGLGRSVCMPGTSNDVAQEYRAASIFVLPSRVEGFPNALLEAMAFGCAPVASHIAGVRMAIDDRVSGVMVPSEDAGALAAELRGLMRDADLRRKYAERATAVAERYAPDRVFQLWRTTLVEAAAR